MDSKCKNCAEGFEVSDEDLRFYDRVSPTFDGKKFEIPVPTFCPDCRLQRRLVWRNERALYKRKCDLTGESFVSWIAPDKPYKAYKNEAWWGDKWNALDYGRDFDFSRPFFEQFDELMKEVPWIGILIDKAVNSDYVNFCYGAKNCYLIYGSNHNEDCMYSNYLTGCSDCVDLLNADDSRLCYSCADVSHCYDCKYCVKCHNSTELLFCENCQNCQNCFGCVNLVGKQYYFFNESLSKEAYEKKVESVGLSAYSSVQKMREIFSEHRLKYPMRYATVINCEDCTGDAIKNSKNVRDGYDVVDVEDSKYVILSHGGTRDCQDVTGAEDDELCYDTTTVGFPGAQICFSAYIWKGVYNLYYCTVSPSSKDCFGCSGLHKGQYCILNKQYSKEEYNEMVPRIIEHMKKTGEWGEFFPGSISPFAYNETIAQDYFPLSEDEALRKNFKWTNSKGELDIESAIPASDLADDIAEVDESVLDKIVKCEVTGKPFKINAKEFKYYKRNHIPLPRKHSDQRYIERMALRNPRKLWNRKCDKCSANIETTYSPGRPEIIYCEECFKQEVYA